MKIAAHLRGPLIHVAIVLLAAILVAGSVGMTEALTLCIGGLVSFITLVSVIWSTTRIFSQKPVALTGISIVIKYALIGGILLYVTQYTQLSVMWVGLGIALILPTLSISGILAVQFDEPNNEDEP